MQTDVLEIGSKGSGLDLFLSTEVKSQHVTLGNGVIDGNGIMTLSFDENALDGNELKVYMDGSLMGATSVFGGSLKLKNTQGLLGSASLSKPSLGRFIGKLDISEFSIDLDSAKHASLYNLGFGDMSLTVSADYNSSVQSDLVRATDFS